MSRVSSNREMWWYHVLKGAHLDLIEVEDQYKPTKIKMNVQKIKSPSIHK